MPEREVAALIASDPTRQPTSVARWRNKVDRQVIIENSDGTGVTDKGAHVSASNMALVRSGVFWEPVL